MRPENDALTSKEAFLLPSDRRASKSNAIEKCGVWDRGKTWHWPGVTLREHLSRVREQKADTEG